MLMQPLRCRCMISAATLQRFGLRFLIAWALNWAWIHETAWRSGGLLPSVQHCFARQWSGLRGPAAATCMYVWAGSNSLFRQCAGTRT